LDYNIEEALPHSQPFRLARSKADSRNLPPKKTLELMENILSRLIQVDLVISILQLVRYHYSSVIFNLNNIGVGRKIT